LVDQIPKKRCGYIALLGKANAGKSTLLNGCIGEKIAGVSRKPQTTRNKILGVTIREGAQCVFLDTPGYYPRKNVATLEHLMSRQMFVAAEEADVICYLVDVRHGLSEEDQQFLTKISSAKSATSPLLLCLSKKDSVKDFLVHERLQEAKRIVAQHPEWGVTSVHAISAKDKESREEFLQRVAPLLPEREWDFEEDALTDRPENFVVSELIREVLFRSLGEEIPYGIGVLVENLERKPEITVVTASILVNRKSHKGMVVGKGGSKIKDIGMEVRQSLEMHFQGKVFLDLMVKHKENWVDDRELVSTIQSFEIE
jgi:GTP-binding protein Era